jgi:hypothetical protein
LSLIDRVYVGEIRAVAIRRDGSVSAELPGSPVVLAGSFNPLHRGHRGLLESGERMTDREGWFELSFENVDKPDLPRKVLEERLEQFRSYRGVIVTRAPRFDNKAKVIPGAIFVIGFDTAVRLVDDRYYEGTPQEGGEPRWAGILREIGALGSSFLVAGRAGSNGNFHELDELQIPAEFGQMFRAVPQELFREDISSTQVRNQAGGDG